MRLSSSALGKDCTVVQDFFSVSSWMWVSSCSSKSCELARLIVYLATAVSTSLPMSSKGQALITASSLPLGMAAVPALPLDCKFMSKKMWSWGQAQLWAWPRAWHGCCQHITSAQSTSKDSATEHKDVEWFIAGEVKLLQIYTYMALVWIQEKKSLLKIIILSRDSAGKVFLCWVTGL